MNNTQAATILTALRDIVEADLLDADSLFRDRSVEAISNSIQALIETGQADPTQIDTYNSVKEFRSDFVHALVGKDRVVQLQRAGRIEI